MNSFRASRRNLIRLFPPIFLLAGFALAGCANSPHAVSMMRPEQLAAVPAQKLCDSYWLHQNEKTLAELRGRAIFTEAEILDISMQTVGSGMTPAAVDCSWGTDHFSVTAGMDPGIEAWNFYGPRHGHQIVFFKDGKVNSGTH